MGTKDRIQYIYCLYTIVSLLNIIRINSYLFMQLAENRVASPKCYQQVQIWRLSRVYECLDLLRCFRALATLSPLSRVPCDPSLSSCRIHGPGVKSEAILLPRV